MNVQQSTVNYERPPRIWGYWILVGICFAVGVVGRIYGAWAGRYISNPDCGVVALMAKHVAEGGQWPVFFYGQSYMGSLEPLLSALLCKVFGVSGFMVCLGTAIAAIATLPIIYFWGRDIGGKSGGLTALALSVVGPYFYFMFQFAPRGGYMVMMVLGLLCMWLSSRTAFELQNGIPVKLRRYFIIGLFAGLGWWTNPLIISALLASAVILAFGLRKKIVSVMPLLGLAGFMLGSLPFWLWNIYNHWQSFDMFFAAGGVALKEGFGYLVMRYDRLMGMDDWQSWLKKVYMWGYLLLAASGMFLGVKSVRHNRLSLRGAGTLTAGFFLFFSVMFFVRSSFATMNTARYLVPLAPVLAVLIGSLVCSLNRKFWVYVAALLVLFLLASYWPVFPDLHGQSSVAVARAKSADELRNFLVKHNIKNLYSSFMFHSLNFNMDEDAVVATMRGERYYPYAKSVELCDDIGFFQHYGYINRFINNSGGKDINGGTERYGVSYGCKPPVGGLKEVDLVGHCEISDHAGRDCTDKLLDRNVNTVWLGTREKNKSEWLQITFDSPKVLRMLRMIGGAAENYPRRMRVEVLEKGKEDWTVLYDNGITGYFWSGPRPYWWGRRHRQEYSLKDLEVSAVRLVSVPTGKSPLLWLIKELQFFAPATGKDFDPIKSLPLLIETLQERGVKHLFADRWESNKVFEQFKGTIRVELNPRVFGDYKWDVDKITDSNSSAILVRDYDASLVEKKLNESGVTYHKEVINDWVLFDQFSLNVNTMAKTTGLIWTGFTLLSGVERRFDITTKAKFSCNIILDGLSVEPSVVRPGGSVTVSFRWHKPIGSAIDNNLAVFTHFIDEDNMFQDDYPLRGFMPELFGGGFAGEDVCYVSRTVQVPKDTMLGVKTLRIGLYNTIYGVRYDIKTSLGTHKQAIVIPNIMTVIEPAIGFDKI